MQTLNIKITASIPMTNLDKDSHTVVVTESDVRSSLQEKCEIYGCGMTCPVYAANGGDVPKAARKGSIGCGCRQNGVKMLEFLRNKASRGSL